MKTEIPQADMQGADIQNSMKTLVALFAGEITGYGLAPFAGGDSAFDRSVSWARGVPDMAAVTVFVRGSWSGKKDIPGVTFISGAQWTVASFFERLASESEGFDHVFIAWADCPFLDPAMTVDLFAKHRKYAAEYTFADGYPYGFSPDILARGIVPILASLCRDSTGPLTRSFVFDAIKKDINSFDIETDIAPVDLRQLRLSLACDTRRNFLLCEALAGIHSANYAETIEKRAGQLRTLPAFYAIQVSGKCPFECAYCPYPAYCRSGKGSSPAVSAAERADFMPLADFSKIIEKIAAFSEDAVVSLSLWGECAFHTEIAELVRTVLSYPGLSVLIETTGLGWKKEAVESIASAAASAAPRTNGQVPVNWVVSLDAVGPSCYGAMHGLPGASDAEAAMREALSFTESLFTAFPLAVWPQMVRMNENETELEPFYRFWKQKFGQVIIQKHDHFCRSIEDRRVADLSPLVRHPCWHLKRDMSILLDGTVPLCREDLYASRSLGNAVRDDLSLIWSGAQPVYENHAGCVYEGMCGACDEYYTYNF